MRCISRDVGVAAAAVNLHEVAKRQPRVVAVGLHPFARGALGGGLVALVTMAIHHSVDFVTVMCWSYAYQVHLTRQSYLVGVSIFLTMSCTHKLLNYR